MPSQADAQVHMRTCLERTDDAVGGAVTRDSAGLPLVVEEVSERQVCHRQGVSPSRVVSEDQAILPAATLRRLVDDVADACLDGSERGGSFSSGDPESPLVMDCGSENTLDVWACRCMQKAHAVGRWHVAADTRFGWQGYPVLRVRRIRDMPIQLELHFCKR